MTQVVELTNIQPKASKRGGAADSAANNSRDYLCANVMRNQRISIFGKYCGKPFNRTFNLGDFAEYDSFNKRYYGEIVSITDKSVVIKPRMGDRTKRLDLYQFIWRNYNFDIDEVIRHNEIESYNI